MDEGLPKLDPQTRARVVTRARRALAPDVHQAIVVQNARLAPSAQRDAHLAALASGAAAVVTGQQVGLFLGPLYTLCKAASAIVIARALAAEAGVPVVPIFWLQTEDHDVVEIATCEVAADTRCEAVSIDVDPENRVSIAHLGLPDAVDDALARLQALIGTGPNAASHLERLRRHYRPGARWSDAFAGVLAELFASEGLVIIDPRDPMLAPHTASIHARAIEDAESIAGALSARCQELEQSGRVVHVHVRPGAPLSFFHPDGAEGPRVRLEPATTVGCFVEVGSGRVHDRSALLAALAADPRRFSTSALLRPIVQDTLLPTAAYVGGPAEVAYFEQLPPLYRAFDRALPLVIERGHFRIIDERARRLLERLGVTSTDLERTSEQDLLVRLRSPEAPRTTDAANRLLGAFRAAHDEVSAELASTSAPTKRALEKTRASVERSVGRFAAKLQKIAAYEDSALVDSVRRARAWLAPDGDLQERRLGLPCFAARLGDRYVVEWMLSAASPFDPSMQELT